jgi:ElaB/YqjD/DUF883 family membrane-anchored ribosome-binding protein
MSGTTPSSGTTGQSTYQAAKDAIGSAAEQARAAAPSAYDTAARGTQYVSGTVSEYPIAALLATAGLVYLLGRLGRSSGDDGSDWQSRAESLRRQLNSLASNLPDTAASARQRGRSVTDYATQTAADASNYAKQGASRAGDYLRQNAGSAGDYVAQGVRDYPASTLIGVAAVGAVFGYLLRGRS